MAQCRSHRDRVRRRPGARRNPCLITCKCCDRELQRLAPVSLSAHRDCIAARVWIFRIIWLILRRSGLLVRIDRAINKDTELHPLVRWQFLGGVPEDKRRAFLFTHVTDAKGRRYDIPVVVGALAASPEIYAIGMGQAGRRDRRSLDAGHCRSHRAGRRRGAALPGGRAHRATTSRRRADLRACRCRSRRPASTPRPI